MAETGTQMVSPPHSSGIRPYSVSCCHDAVGICAGLIHLIDGYNDGNSGRLGVVDGLDGLRHNAVVSRDDENGDIGAPARRAHAWR